LVGDTIEVDESSLKDENAIRVKVNYKDATKIEGSTLVYINGQGHMITWWRKKKVDVKPKNPPPSKTSKFDSHKNDTDEEGDKDESVVSHESKICSNGQGAEGRGEKKKKQKHVVGDKQTDGSEPYDNDEFLLSQTNQEDSSRGFT
jgi:hypothetical protein